jgi:lambda family phage tail tape measure protein
MADFPTRIILSAEDRATAVIGQAQKSLQSLAATMTSMPSLAAGFSVGAIATGMIALTKSSIDYMATLHDMSISTGATVESLSAMKEAAKLAGTDMESVAGAVKKLGISLGEAKLKGGAKADLLAAIGIDPKRVTDTGQALFEVAKRLDGMGDKTKALAIARELLGKEVNMAFLNELAAQGKLIAQVTTEQAAAADQFQDSMVKLKSGAGQLGIALANSALPAMNDILDFSLLVKKEWGTIAAIIFGLGGGTILKALGLELDPLKRAANETAEALRELKRAKDALDNASRASQDSVIPGMNDFRRWLVGSKQQGIADASANVKAAMAEEARLQKEKTEQDYAEYQRKKKAAGNSPKDGSLGTKKDDFGPLMRQLAERNSLLSAELGSTEKLTEAQKLALKIMTDLGGGYISLTDAQKRQLTAQLESMLATDKAAQQWKDFDEATKEYLKHRQELLAIDQSIADLEQSYGRQNQNRRADMQIMPDSQRELLKALNQVDEDARREKRNLDRNLSDGKISTDEYAERLANLNAAIATQKDEVRALSDEQERLNGSWGNGAATAMQKYADSVSNVSATTEAAVTRAFGGMEDALVNFATTGKLDFKSLADSIIADMMRIQIQQSIMKPLSGMMGDGLKSMFSGIFGGGRASGGPVYPGQYYVVGENGPEILMPSAAGNIIPNGAIAATGSGGDVSITQHINIDSRSDKASIMQAMIAAKEQAKAEIMASMRRGGAFA